MPTFAHHSLGCKVNQYDAERTLRHLIARGLTPVDSDADLVVLASCTVTGAAAADSRQHIRALLGRNPSARVAVQGCMTEDDRRFYAALPAAVTFLPSARREEFLSDLEPLLEGLIGRSTKPAGLPLRRKTRAFVKIEDGCDLACSFCIIPTLRGPARSRPLDQVLAEIRDEVEQGCREVVLTGIHLGHYGRRSPHSLVDALRAIARLPDEFRVRVSSIEASELDDAVLEALSAPRFVPHLHLPLQSGSDRVLKRMRRPYSRRRFLERVARARDLLEDPALSTDVIVGFPGEHESDHRATLELCQEVGFTRLHVFPFSKRAGTSAANDPDQVPADVLRCRRDEMLRIAETLKFSAESNRIDTVSEVLIEKRIEMPTEKRIAGVALENAFEGLDERYHRVRIESRQDLRRGQMLKVRIRSRSERGLSGRPENESMVPSSSTNLA